MTFRSMSPISLSSLAKPSGREWLKETRELSPQFYGATVSQTAESQCDNTLLAALSLSDRELLEQHWTRVKLDREEVLVVPNEPIEHVYFMEGGVASITSNSPENGRTEIGIFGRDGVSGTSLLLGADRSPHETFVQVDGSHALRIDAAAFMQAVASSDTLRQMMLRFVQTLLVQTGQSAVANARYQIEARLARWLLMCHDRTDGDEIALTHEFMAIIIGATAQRRHGGAAHPRRHGDDPLDAWARDHPGSGEAGGSGRRQLRPGRSRISPTYRSTGLDQSAAVIKGTIKRPAVQAALHRGRGAKAERYRCDRGVLAHNGTREL